MNVSVLEGELGGALSVDGGWLPLPTRPQQYCDPVSLVGTSGSLPMYGVTIDEEEQKQISSMTNSRMLFS